MFDKNIRLLAVITVPVVIVILLLALGLASDTGEPETISVRDAWVRATAPTTDADASRVTGAFMILDNPSDQAERLVSVAVDPGIAGVVEVHETTLDANDVMQMRPVEGIDIPAGESVELKPGSYHIMLIDVQTDLAPGDTVTLTLTFESGVTLDVEAPGREMASMGAGE